MTTRSRLVPVVLGGLLLAGCGTGPIGAPRHPLHVAAPQSFRRGQFWYTRTISSDHAWLPAGGTIERPRGYFDPVGPKVRFDLRISDETWIGVDGTVRERVLVAGARFASAAGRATWERTRPLVPREGAYAAAYRRPLPDFNHVGLGVTSHDALAVGGERFPPQPWPAMGEWLGPFSWDVGDSLFGYRELVALPTKPGALRARLTQAEKALAGREHRGGLRASMVDANAFGQLTEIADLLASPVPERLRLALFHAAVTTPGVRVDARARDARGRAGVAVSATAGPAFERLIFDPATGALLEQGPGATVVAEGVVDSAYALPKSVKPIRPAGAPREPQVPAISPSVGSRSSAFTLTLLAPLGQRSQRAPALDWMLIGTPGGRCFAGFLPRLARLTGTASTLPTGRRAYLYRLTPARVHRRNWCPGRYELTVLPVEARGPHVLSVSQSILLAQGSSVYFRVA